MLNYRIARLYASMSDMVAEFLIRQWGLQTRDFLTLHRFDWDVIQAAVNSSSLMGTLSCELPFYHSMPKSLLPFKFVRHGCFSWRYREHGQKNSRLLKVRPDLL